MSSKQHSITKSYCISFLINLGQKDADVDNLLSKIETTSKLFLPHSDLSLKLNDILINLAANNQIAYSSYEYLLKY